MLATHKAWLKISYMFFNVQRIDKYWLYVKGLIPDVFVNGVSHSMILDIFVNDISHSMILDVFVNGVSHSMILDVFVNGLFHIL